MSLDKIENELMPEIEHATAKGNTNRILAALAESIRQLVEVAKQTTAAAEAVTVAPAPVKAPAKKPVAKKPAAKKPAAKKPAAKKVVAKD